MQAKSRIGRFADYYFEMHNIGERDDKEILAAHQLNHMLTTLDKVLPEFVQKKEISELYLKMWEDWGRDTQRLDATKAAISAYAIDSLKNHIKHSLFINPA